MSPLKPEKNSLLTVRKKPLDLSLSLWFVRSCMDKSDPEACRDMLQMMGTKGRSVVGIDFSGQSSGQERFFKGFQIRFERFGEIKLGMRNQPGMIVDEGNEIGLSSSSPHAPP